MQGNANDVNIQGASTTLSKESEIDLPCIGAAVVNKCFDDDFEINIDADKLPSVQGTETFTSRM